MGVAELGVASAEMGVVLVSLMLLFSLLLLLLLVLEVTSKLFSELLLSRPKRAGPGILTGRGGWLSSSVRSIVSEKKIEKKGKTIVSFFAILMNLESIH